MQAAGKCCQARERVRMTATHHDDQGVDLWTEEGYREAIENQRQGVVLQQRRQTTGIRLPEAQVP